MLRMKKVDLLYFLISFLFFSISAMEGDTLKPLAPYNWNMNYNMVASAPSEPGNQVLHTKPTNKPYKNNSKSVEFVSNFLADAKACESDAEVLNYATQAVCLTPSFWLEMGVGMARTINFIGGLAPKVTIHGFDSFEGLPEDWNKGDKIFPKGTFAVRDPKFSPPVLNNVRIYQGLFSEVLPKFKKQIMGEGTIGFLHIDCDSYGPTSEVFSILGSKIVPGTVIVFDELYNYPNYEEHEWKAFQEFLKNSGLHARFIAYNINHEQVAVQITQ